MNFLIFIHHNHIQMLYYLKHLINQEKQYNGKVKIEQLKQY